MLTNIIHQLVGGKVVKDIVRRCILSNSVSLGLSKHLFLPIVGKERGGEGETSTKQTHTDGSPSSLAPLLLILTILLLLLLWGNGDVLLLGSNPWHQPGKHLTVLHASDRHDLQREGG